MKSRWISSAFVFLLAAPSLLAQNGWTLSGNETSTPNTVRVFGTVLPQFTIESATEARLQLKVNGVYRFLVNHDGSNGAIGTQSGGGGLQLQTASATRMFIDTAGKVGIGTLLPGAKLDVGGWTGMPGDIVNAMATVGGDGFFGNHGGGRARLSANGVQGFLQWNLYYNGSGLKSMDNTRPGYELDFNSNTETIAFRRYPVGTGNLAPDPILTMTKATTGYDVTVNGKLTANQVINAVFQDIAEWVPATAPMPAGTVVVLNTNGVNEVMPSSRAYDTSVAGVVSAQPGMVLGVAGESKAQIATYGRVKVRVDATKAPIRTGDLLVTSDEPGTAMRSEPFEVAGRTMHQPGTILGKALEPLASGHGEILVLLSLQ